MCSRIHPKLSLKTPVATCTYRINSGPKHIPVFLFSPTKFVTEYLAAAQFSHILNASLLRTVSSDSLLRIVSFGKSPQIASSNYAMKRSGILANRPTPIVLEL